jgi:hypothetical protein
MARERLPIFELWLVSTHAMVQVRSDVFYTEMEARHGCSAQRGEEIHSLQEGFVEAGSHR